MSDKPNGLNINENCGALHPVNLAAEVKRLRADVGFAFDGDADRLVVVDEKAKWLMGIVYWAYWHFILKNKVNYNQVLWLL